MRQVSVSAVAYQITLRQQELSETVAAAVLNLFKISVVSTLTLTILLASLDTAVIYGNVIEPDDRLITEGVIMSIIGASIVQVGASAIAIVYSLFRRSAALKTDPPVDGDTD